MEIDPRKLQLLLEDNQQYCSRRNNGGEQAGQRQEDSCGMELTAVGTRWDF